MAISGVYAKIMDLRAVDLLYALLQLYNKSICNGLMLQSHPQPKALVNISKISENIHLGEHLQHLQEHLRSQAPTFLSQICRGFEPML